MKGATGPSRLMETATSVLMEKRDSVGVARFGTCLKMLNDIKIEDRLRSDASSLDGRISEFQLFSGSRSGRSALPSIVRFGRV